MILIVIFLALVGVGPEGTLLDWATRSIGEVPFTCCQTSFLESMALVSRSTGEDQPQVWILMAKESESHWATTSFEQVDPEAPPCLETFKLETTEMPIVTFTNGVWTVRLRP